MRSLFMFTSGCCVGVSFVSGLAVVSGLSVPHRIGVAMLVLSGVAILSVLLPWRPVAK
jgi:hypothetical protein